MGTYNMNKQIGRKIMQYYTEGNRHTQEVNVGSLKFDFELTREQFLAENTFITFPRATTNVPG